MAGFLIREGAKVDARWEALWVALTVTDKPLHLQFVLVTTAPQTGDN